MTTFTFNRNTADRLMNDLNAGRVVRLTKSNRSAIVLQDGNDIDEFGDHIYRMTIQPAQGDSTVRNVPMNETDIWNLLFGEKFAEYGIVER